MNQNELLAVPASERTGQSKDLFFIWFANNIGILGIVMGAMLTAFGLSFVQSVLAAFLAALSFMLVGFISVIGKRTAITTFIMSRATFGTKGNIIPNLVAWINLVGWLAVNVVTGTLIITSIFAKVANFTGTVAIVIGLLIFSGLVLLSGSVKQEQLAKIQTFFTYVFGGLTLIILLILISQTNWQEVLAMPTGSWGLGFLPAVSIIAAGTGINWTIAGADYSAYQRPSNSDRSVFWSVTLGAFIPLFVILFAGVLIATVSPSLSSTTNPIDVIGQALPSWISVIYLITAVGGIIPQCIVSLQSAKTNLDALNIRVSQRNSLLFHGALMIGLPFFVLFFSESFLDSFQMFLGLLGIVLAAWAAVFSMDYVLNRREGYETQLMVNDSQNKVNLAAVIAWGIGVILGFLCTNTPLFTGIWAKGIFEDNSLGVFVAFLSSGCLLMVLNKPLGRRVDDE